MRLAHQDGVARLAALLIVSLLALPLLPICAEQAPAAHDCCQKPASAPKAAKIQPCCMAPSAPAVPTTASMASPPARTAGAVPLVPRALAFRVNDVPAVPETPSLEYLRHVALLN